MQTKKFISVLLTLLVMAGVIAVAPITASAAAAPGDKLFFGNYPQSFYSPKSAPASPTKNVVYTDTDGTKFVYNGGPWNKIEPIEWQVLKVDGGKVLLLSEKLLDNKEYHPKAMNAGITWEQCGLRAFLNGGTANPYEYSFIDRAFSAAEKAAIQTTKVHTPNNMQEKTYGGEDTDDKIFVLSVEEVNDYAFNPVAVVTPFGGSSYANGNTFYWRLRSPGGGIKYDSHDEPPWSYSGDTAYVRPDGTVSIWGCALTSNYGTRPALWVLESALTTLPTGTAPGITGPAALTLTAGYAATSTGTYTITGTAPVTVTKQSGDAKITWNNATKKLDIAAGLAAGTYPVTLKAANGVSPDASFTFTLKVNAAGGGGKTIFNTGRAATFLNWILFIVFFGWLWM